MIQVNEKYAYELTENGYYIYVNGVKTIYQYEPFIPNPNLSYEENAEKQIADMVAADNAPKIENEIERLTNVELALAELYESRLGE